MLGHLEGQRRRVKSSAASQRRVAGMSGWERPVWALLLPSSCFVCNEFFSKNLFDYLDEVRGPKEEGRLRKTRPLLLRMILERDGGKEPGRVWSTPRLANRV